MASKRGLILLILFNLCSAQQEATYSDGFDYITRFLEQEQDVITQCHFYVSASIKLSNDIYEWILEHSRGVTSLDIQFASTLNGSDLRRFWSASKCSMLIDSGTNITRAQNLLDKVVYPHKVLVIASNDIKSMSTVYQSKKRSFDMVFASFDSVEVACQGFGNLSIIPSSNLKSCNSFLPILKQSQMQVSLAPRFPYTLSNSGDLQGPDLEILNLLKEKFGFHYALKVEANYGIVNLPNGTIFGYFASMGSRDSEFGIGELLGSSDRFKYADFSTPMYYTQNGFATPLPHKVNALHTIWYPMDATTWIYMAASMVLVMLVLVLIDHMFGKEHPASYQFFDIAIVYSLLIQYNSPHFYINFKSFGSRRLLLCFWIPVAMLISMGYKSMLLTKLMFVEYENPIDTAEDILNSGLPVVVGSLTTTQAAIRDSKLPVYQKIYKNQVLEKNCVVPFNGTFPPWVYQKIREGSIIAANDVLIFNQSISHIAKKILVAQNTHLMFPHNSRFKPLADKYLSQLKAMGFLQFFFNKYHSSTLASSQDRSSRSSEPGPITITHIMPMLIISFLGYTTAATIFIVLHITSRLNRRIVLLQPKALDNNYLQVAAYELKYLKASTTNK